VEDGLNVRGAVGFWDIALFEGGFDGAVEGGATVERAEEKVVLSRESLVVDGVFVTVHREVNLLAERFARACATVEVNTDRI
jgi:hypothetical protein